MEVHSERVGGSGHQWQEGKFWFHTKKKSVYSEGDEVLGKVSGVAVESSSLEIIKTWQDPCRTWSDFLTDSTLTEGLGKLTPRGPFGLNNAMACNTSFSMKFRENLFNM